MSADQSEDAMFSYMKVFPLYEVFSFLTMQREVLYSHIDEVERAAQFCLIFPHFRNPMATGLLLVIIQTWQRN